MTPIYRSPDQEQANAIQSLLQEHNIHASVIETRKTSQPFGSSAVTWYELWLRHYADASRAKSIITQHEFTTFRTNMSSYRTTVGKNDTVVGQTGAENATIANGGVKSAVVDTMQPAKRHSTVDELVIDDQELMGALKSQPMQALAPENQSPAVQQRPPAPHMQRREDLIPINNKRVFKRLGLLLGYSEEEIDKLDNNKLYRPWDGDSLMEKIKNLKQKCS